MNIDSTNIYLFIYPQTTIICQPGYELNIIELTFRIPRDRTPWSKRNPLYKVPYRMISHDILIIHPDNCKHGPFLNMLSMKRQVDCMSGTSHLKISRTHKFHHEPSTNLAVLPESGTAPKKSWSRRDWRLWGLRWAHFSSWQTVTIPPNYNKCMKSNAHSK